jgi:RimJ/RimL family protein N-acetyltransferase
MGLPMDMEAVSGYLAEQERLSEKAWSKRQHLAVERRDGVFIGEAKLEAPSGEGICEPDVKLLPAYWGQGYGLEIITALINQSFRRFPLCGIVQFTPNFNNRVAIRLYAKVGCRVVGQGFTPPQPRRGFVGVRYLIMQIDRHAWEGGEACTNGDTHQAR